MKLVIAPQAAKDIDTVERWWAANRPGAPQLFSQELLRTYDLIATMPRAGALLRGHGPSDVRRVALDLLYYRGPRGPGGGSRAEALAHEPG